jgi:hypothetical protein
VGTERIAPRLATAARRVVFGGILFAAVTTAAGARAADPMAECIAHNEKSLDLRKQGRLLDSRRELAACSAAPCPEAIQQACRARMTEVNAAIPSIVWDVRDAAGQDLIDAQLWIDGQPAGTVGVAARQLDPGRHVFRFEATGRREAERTIVLREGDRDHRESVVLGGPASPAAPVASAPDAPPPIRTPEAATARSEPVENGAAPSGGSGGDSLRTAGWLVGGAGVVTMVVGGALGLVAKSSYDGASGCTGTTCNQGGFDARSSARTMGDVATVVFVAGAATTAVGIVLWIVGPSVRRTASGPRLQVGLTPGGVVAGGSY